MKRFAITAALCGAALFTAIAVAQDARTVATVGTHKITVAEVHKRLGQAPLFQLKNLGDTPHATKRGFVERLAELELLVQGAEDMKLDEKADVRDRIRAVLTSALLQDLRREAREAGDVSDAEILAYYQNNKDKYKSQQRIKIWQIVVQSRAEAQEILNFMKSDENYLKDPVASWEALARERSIDKSTSMRKGNLGFVQPDGTTAHKDIVVPRALYDAAATIQDGETYPEPLQIEKFWVVLQRRGSHNTPERTLEREAKTIRGLLAKSKVQQRTKDLLDELRNKYVSDVNHRQVDLIEIGHDGEIAPKGRPGTLRRSRPARGRGRPHGRPGNMR